MRVLLRIISVCSRAFKLDVLTSIYVSNEQDEVLMV